MVKCPEKSFDTCHNEIIENHCEYWENLHK
jgi:hypothetical protein